MLHPILYDKDSKGRLRTWQAETDGDRYRTVSGLADGKKITTEWTTARPTNVGRSNERQGEAQALFEVDSMYADQRNGGYSEDVEKAGIRSFFKPMLAKTFKGWAKMKWYSPLVGVDVQGKLDGLRVVITSDAVRSRTGKDFLGLAFILEELADFFAACPFAVIDAEIYNHDLRDDFNKIVSLVKKETPDPAELAECKSLIEVHCYDFVPSPIDAISPYEDRMKLFRELHASLLVGTRVKVVDTFRVNSEEQMRERYGKFMEAGYEGLMIRNPNAGYDNLNERSDGLLKVKDFLEEEFEAMGVAEGDGNRSGMAGVVFCRRLNPKPANLVDQRKIWTEMDEAGVKFDRSSDWLYFKATPKGKTEVRVALLKAGHVGVAGKPYTVQFQSFTPDGIPRFPVGKGCRDFE